MHLWEEVPFSDMTSFIRWPKKKETNIATIMLDYIGLTGFNFKILIWYLKLSTLSSYFRLLVKKDWTTCDGCMEEGYFYLLYPLVCCWLSPPQKTRKEKESIKTITLNESLLYASSKKNDHKFLSPNRWQRIITEWVQEG